MAAIALAVVAFGVAWIPCFSWFSFFFSGVGLVLGIIGIVMALSDKKTGVILPAAGTVMCAGTMLMPCIISFLWMALFGTAAHKVSKDVQRAAEKAQREQEEAQKKLNQNGNQMDRTPVKNPPPAEKELNKDF